MIKKFMNLRYIPIANNIEIVISEKFLNQQINSQNMVVYLSNLCSEILPNLLTTGSTHFFWQSLCDCSSRHHRTNRLHSSLVCRASGQMNYRRHLHSVSL